MKLILASASPRRQELLTQVGLNFEVFPSTIEEKIDATLPPEKIVQQLSYSKAKDVASQALQDCIVIGADTVVAYKNNILGKPKNNQEAYKMLKMLSGNVHHVITGFTIIRTSDDKAITSFEKTLVEFNDLSDSEIDRYISIGEFEDKAGAYGIQGVGSLLVNKIEGDYFNVVGLPLSKVVTTLNREFGIRVL
ncbi:MAG: nucleoside triphosphate pyrophosphatase [Clostridia bacterium]